MNKLILTAALLLGHSGWATSICSGKTSDDVLVTITISTDAKTGQASRGEVEVETDGHQFGYRFEGQDLAQYFASEDAEREQVIVGASGFVLQENPVFLRYAGPNFIDMDLKRIVQSPDFTPIEGAMMHIWKGPNYAATDQYQVVGQIACSVWTDI